MLVTSHRFVAILIRPRTFRGLLTLNRVLSGVTTAALAASRRGSVDLLYGSMSPHEDLVVLVDTMSVGELSFTQKAGAVGEFIEALAADRLLDLLAEAGFIPEHYEHDSSEEKVYAKAMDWLVAAALGRLGYDVSVLDERANAADVLARCLNGSENTVALDAKAFRLSRTALNPKDYKIEALSTWRKDEKYAALVGPIIGFPEGQSRLYSEAVKFDVTLLTFSHLRFLLEHGVAGCEPMERIWQATTESREAGIDVSEATAYWQLVDTEVCQVASASLDDWKKARRTYLDALLRVADQQIAYFNAEREKLEDLPKEALLGIAVGALRFDAKIRQISGKRDKAMELLAELDEAES